MPDFDRAEGISAARQIAENSGVEGSIVVGKLPTARTTIRLRRQNEIYVDMIKAGIVDPAKVVRTALQDAGSIAALLITAEAKISDIRPRTQAPAGGGMAATDHRLKCRSAAPDRRPEVEPDSRRGGSPR
jgi:hypothetical protein